MDSSQRLISARGARTPAWEEAARSTPCTAWGSAHPHPAGRQAKFSGKISRAPLGLRGNSQRDSDGLAWAVGGGRGGGERGREVGAWGWMEAGVGRAGAPRAAGEGVGGLGGGRRRSRPGLTQLNCSKSLRKRLGTGLPSSLPARLPAQ